MKRFLLVAVAALTLMPDLAAAQERGHEGEQRPGGGQPGGGQRPGGGQQGQRPGGGQPGGQRPGGQPGGQRPGPQVQPARPAGPQVQPGRGGDNRPGRPGGDNRPGFGNNNPGLPGGDNRPDRPGGNFQRPPSYRPPPGYWNGNNWNRPRLSGSGYNYPRGYSYRRWSPGLFLPSLLFSSSYFFNGYQSLGLYAPPYGYHWIRYGPDLLLVEDGTRRIVDARYGVFG